jgi:hypothetical protein
LLLGQTDPLWLNLSVSAATALLGALAVSSVTLLFTYGRHLKQIIEAKPVRGSANSGRLLDRVGRFFAPSSGRRAGFDFFLLTVTRSQRHRLALAALLALGLAVSIQGSVVSVFGLTANAQTTINTLSLPLICSFFVIAALLWVTTIPLGSRPAWILEIVGTDRYPDLIEGARRAVGMTSIAAPMAIAVIAFTWKFPLALAIRYLLMTTLLVLLAAAVAGRQVRQVPFSTRMRRLRPPHLIVVLIGGWLLFTAYAYETAQLQMWAAETLTRTSIVSVVLVTFIAVIACIPIELIPPDDTRWTDEEGLLLAQLEP